ncbi:MAG: hypothetical protein HY563_07720 [Ignavibacteriales bacterium]|nr:hypothetical protein [Ignavibacteriales bacterium]
MELSAYKRCTNCDGEVTGDSDFCPHCGQITSEAISVFCARHPTAVAVAVCIICRQLVCRACALQKRGRWFCRDHAAVRVEQDWALVFESPDINDAELVKSILDSAGFHVVVRNFGPNTAVWEGGGDSLFSRQALNRLAKVFVPIPEYVEAERSCREWKDAGNV